MSTSLPKVLASPASLRLGRLRATTPVDKTLWGCDLWACSKQNLEDNTTIGLPSPLAKRVVRSMVASVSAQTWADMFSSFCICPTAWRSAPALVMPLECLL